MLAVSKVSDPCLQSGRVILPHLLAVGLDGGFAGNGGPFAAAGKEGEIDVRVGFEVIGLAGFAVCVEEKVDPVTLLSVETLLADVRRSDPLP